MIRRLLEALVLLAAIPALVQAQVDIVPVPFISSSGVVSGQLSIPDGTAGDPSIIFTSSDDGTGTGIYNSGVDRISFSINGGEEIPSYPCCAMTPPYGLMNPWISQFIR